MSIIQTGDGNQATAGNNSPIINFSPYQILKSAINKVPQIKYALGIAGIAGSIAIIKSFGIDNFKVPLVSILILIGLMILLFVFSVMAKSKHLKPAGYILIYTTIIIACLSALLLFTSVFFKFPDKIENILPLTQR